ncbi:hypothetical protein H1Q63_28875 [Desmonostoc muscorum CCALA 125]|nr:hypothetical protein [Desmonostoc muscorum CCALA 125]
MGNGEMRGMRGMREQGDEFSPLPPAPRPFGSFQYPIPNAQFPMTND